MRAAPCLSTGPPIRLSGNSVIIGSVLPPIDTSEYTQLHCWWDDCEASLPIIRVRSNLSYREGGNQKITSNYYGYSFCLQLTKHSPTWRDGYPFHEVFDSVPCVLLNHDIHQYKKPHIEPQDSWRPKRTCHTIRPTALQSIHSEKHSSLSPRRSLISLLTALMRLIRKDELRTTKTSVKSKRTAEDCCIPHSVQRCASLASHHMTVTRVTTAHSQHRM